MMKIPCPKPSRMTQETRAEKSFPFDLVHLATANCDMRETEPDAMPGEAVNVSVRSMVRI